MDTSKILTGEQLVQKGATKQDVLLPEIGLKDVIPDGSWLEQKQIQAALEARKHLLEVEKIEKCGVLSHAEWDPELGLAAVRKNVGGCWQYCGHSAGGQLYLLPEEALFLMEVNSLHLTFNEVTVSLQQAYSLLLRGKVKITQYKVYSSLSRLGYKVFRHEYVQPKTANKAVEKHCESSEGNENKMKSDINKDAVEPIVLEKNKVEKESDPIVEKSNGNNNIENTLEISSTKKENSEDIEQTSSKIETENQDELTIHKAPSRKEQKLQKLRERQSFCKNKIGESFESIPEMYRKVTVKVGVPEQNLFPRNVFPNKMEYDLDLDRIKLKNAASPPAEARDRSYSVTEEDNTRMRRINDNIPPLNQTVTWNPRYHQQRFPPRLHYGSPRFWNFGRPRFNNAMFNMFAQRPYFYPQPNFNFPARGPQYFNVRPQMNQFRERRKRSHEESQQFHLQKIKELAAKLKQLAAAGVIHQVSFEALKTLLRTYNLRFNTKLALVNNFDLVEDESIETIDLDDEEPKAKVPRNNEETKKYKESFKQLKELSQNLKTLDSKHLLYSRHRRAFSNLVREFNKTYNADVFLDSTNDVVDRNLIVLDSSDSDCVVEEPIVESKKVINPFNVLRLQTRKDKGEPSTSKFNTNISSEESDLFGKWLPKDDEYGKVEVISKAEANNLIRDVEKEYYIYDFLKHYNNYEDCKNWNQVKTLFWELIEEKAVEKQTIESYDSKESLLKVEDCKDVSSALEKLRVIPPGKELLDECNLEIHFDVYNRDVQNFKKSNKPKPHFRVCVVSESSAFPSGSEVATLLSKYSDNVPITFAVVSESIAYLQIKPEDIPVYLGREE